MEQKLSLVEDDLRLYNSPLFDPFRKLMKEEEGLALKTLLNGRDDQMVAMREKLRTLRLLQNHEQKLRDERTRLIKQLEEA